MAAAVLTVANPEPLLWPAQLTDISQWGSAEEAARLLLPRGARLLAASAAVVSQPPRDTGTLVGVVEQAPRTIYRRGPWLMVRRRADHRVCCENKLSRTPACKAYESRPLWCSVCVSLFLPQPAMSCRVE